MNKNLTIIGAPSSAGAYGPGQEKTPAALRAAGLQSFFEQQDVTVHDKKDVVGYRWKIDRQRPQAMNISQVAEVAQGVAGKVHDSMTKNEKTLVIGGDCTIELGTVAGCLNETENIGLIYIDLDTDLNTPHSVRDGALDWMGVAHMLNIEGTEEKLTTLAKRTPMLLPEQIHFFANGNMESFEKDIIKSNNIRQTQLREVSADPVGTARKIREEWAPKFDRILIHLDADVLDFVDMQLAENYRRNIGLKFDQLMIALEEFLKAPNWSVLTITEINPDHGEQDSSTLRVFAERLAKTMAPYI